MSRNACLFVYIQQKPEIKGVRILLQAWAEIKDTKLILCGSGPLDAWCREYVEKNRVENVEIKGQVPRPAFNSRSLSLLYSVRQIKVILRYVPSILCIFIVIALTSVCALELL